MIGTGTIALRLLLAAMLGALLGFEREIKDRPAGLRTHTLVSLGACLFTLISAYGFSEFTKTPTSSAVRADVTRIASQVVVGIGFLGGGTILRYKGAVRGLTTAATLWVTAAVGLAIGAGFYSGGAIGAGIGILTLAGLKPVERMLGHKSEPEEGSASGDAN